jgi:ribosome-associated protein
MSSFEDQIKASKAMADQIVAICEDIKAVDILVFDMTQSASIADFYVLCTGNSEPHLRAIGDKLEKEMKDSAHAANAIDGGASSQWIVMDFDTVIVHVMHPDARSYYNLETLWANGQLPPEKLPWECPESEVLRTERQIRRPGY